MKELFDFLDKWLSPVKKPSGSEDVVDSLVLFIIMVLLLVAMFK